VVRFDLAEDYSTETAMVLVKFIVITVNGNLKQLVKAILVDLLQCANNMVFKSVKFNFNYNDE
jgi:phosphopantothenate synthetase